MHVEGPQTCTSIVDNNCTGFARIKNWETRNQSQAIPERKKAEFRRTFDGMRPKLAKALAAETLVKERVAKGTWDYKVNAQSSAGAKGKYNVGEWRLLCGFACFAARATPNVCGPWCVRRIKKGD